MKLAVLFLGVCLLMVSCSANNSYVIISKSKNSHPDVWCQSDTQTCIQNVKTGIRSIKCGNFGSIGETIKLED
jgi:hypothetical protein